MNVLLMAEYNRWMNEKVYAAATNLTEDEFMADKKAFFGSVCGTLNHLLVGDLIWLNRFSTLHGDFSALQPLAAFPKPHAIDQCLFNSIGDLKAAREKLDEIILAFAGQVSPLHLELNLQYRNTKGEAHSKPFGELLQHFFNHQTHHRGQVTTLLSQFGKDVGATDLLLCIADA